MDTATSRTALARTLTWFTLPAVLVAVWALLYVPIILAPESVTLVAGPVALLINAGLFVSLLVRRPRWFNACVSTGSYALVAALLIGPLALYGFGFLFTVTATPAVILEPAALAATLPLACVLTNFIAATAVFVAHAARASLSARATPAYLACIFFTPVGHLVLCVASAILAAS